MGEAVDDSGFRRIGWTAGKVVRPLRTRPFGFLELETDIAGEGFRDGG
jgi:hypothetical protein